MNFRKYVLPSALIICLAAASGIAQTINKAIQLSQDATGAFGVDTNNGIYFPGHVLSPTNTNQPLPTITGTATAAITGTDSAGTITMGTSATTALVSFGRAYLSVPACVVAWQASTGTLTPISYSLTGTAITITQGATTGNKINYWCSSAS